MPRTPITRRFIHSDAVLAIAAAGLLLAVIAFVLTALGAGL